MVSVQPHDSVSFDVSVSNVSKFSDLNVTFVLLIQLKTTKRSYQFSAGESREAKEWVDKIQACLQ